MYKTTKIIIIIFLLVFLTSCSDTEDYSYEKELDSLKMENEMLKNEIEDIKKENDELVSYELQVNNLSIKL